MKLLNVINGKYFTDEEINHQGYRGERLNSVKLSAAVFALHEQRNYKLYEIASFFQVTHSTLSVWKQALITRSDFIFSMLKELPKEQADGEDITSTTCIKPRAFMDIENELLRHENEYLKKRLKELISL